MSPNAPAPRWWEIRTAQNTKPVTYRCPLCGRHLPALQPHLLLRPEGRGEGRRHAHVACVQSARRAGRLPTREEWQRAQPRQPSWWRRLLGDRNAGG